MHAAFGDHYYWLTSQVSSRSAGTTACRLVAAVTLLLGIIPLLLVGESSRWQIDAPLLAAAAVCVVCTTIAAIWGRGSWPSRAQSRACALAGTAAVVAAVTVIPDPLVAVLGCLAFAGPTGFTALFHGRRMLVPLWTLGAAALAVSAFRLAALHPMLALVVPPMVVMVNVFAARSWLLVIDLADSKIDSAQIDPLTLVLNREGFDQQVALLLGARARQHDRYLVVAIVSVDTYGLLLGLGQDRDADQACRSAAAQLRDTIRRDTVLAYCGDGDFAIAELFVDADPAVMLERIRMALTGRPAQLSASIGSVSTPLQPLSSYPVHDVVDELLSLAGQARDAARHDGGNTAHSLLDPALRILDDPDDAA